VKAETAFGSMREENVCPKERGEAARPEWEGSNPDPGGGGGGMAYVGRKDGRAESKFGFVQVVAGRKDWRVLAPDEEEEGMVAFER
jgi:hypothetical protein